ncbi:MAG TPA: adenine phosphoribosyltransferase [Ignavibacteriaceae bacterium]|nr:adenine phosphoribosyltransferase [Ignavibacteriaceae bacterium]
MSDLKNYIRSIKDFPKQGIMFRDITTLLKEPDALKETINQLYNIVKDKNINKVVGIESRGFILGGALAEKLGCGFVPVRKPNKLPAERISESYYLEYGEDKIEIHKDAIQKGDRVLMHDDLLATGGTMEAACKLIEKLGGEVVQISFIIELSFLNGRDKLKNFEVHSLVVYNDEN